MKSLFTICCIVLMSTAGLYAQDFFSGIDKLIFEENTVIRLDETKAKANYLPFLKAIRKQETLERTITGVLGFGLNLKNSQNTDLTQFSVSADISKGYFPGDLSFKSAVNIQVQNGQFVENLSDLTMTYDHHIGNDLNYEMYAFLKRSSNNFLNIDQRYEIGVGGVWNVILSGKDLQKFEKKFDDKITAISKQETTTEAKEAAIKKAERIRRKGLRRRLTKRGLGNYDKIHAFDISGEKLTGGSNEDFLQLCNDTLCEKPNFSLETEEVAQFKKGLNRSMNSVIKHGTKVRVSLLAGVNYESERTSDSLKVFRRDSIRKESFAPVTLFRVVVAPIVKVIIDKVTLKSRCYFKVGISDSDYESVVKKDDFEDSRVDMRIEWTNSATIAFTDKISLAGSLNYTHINAPRRQFYEQISGEMGLYKAANRFLDFRLQLQYKL